MTDAVAGAGGAEAKSFGAPAYRGYVLIALTMVYTLNFIDRNLLSVIAQPVITTFGLSDSQYGFLNGPPFALFYALMGIPIAAAADRYNRVVIIAICIAIWSLMAALCGFATSFLFLLCARVGVAIGEAGCTPPANSIIGDYFQPRSRANALGIYAMGVTLGGALSNAFGGPIATGLKGTAVQSWLAEKNIGWAVNAIDWSHVEGWRMAFVLTGAPGLLIGLLVLFTVKEPPRGYSDPAAAQSVEKANMTETLRELFKKPTFWSNAMACSLVALVGYGLSGFQAPMMQRIHGISPGDFALHYGVPLSLFSALGTFLGGFLTERLAKRSPTAVAWIPGIGVLLAIPLYETAYFMPTAQLGLALPIWCAGAVCHYSYLGSQYTIGQGVASQRSRASAVALMLLMIALIGNGLGPQIVGWMSDMFMTQQINAHNMGGILTNAICRAKDVSHLTADQQAICKSAYGEGLRMSMAATALIFIPTAAFFFLAGLTLKKDMVAKH